MFARVVGAGFIQVYPRPGKGMLARVKVAPWNVSSIAAKVCSRA